MAFDVAGARQAGYSEDEIADYLAAESNFDAAAARQAGYSSAEILSHLTAKEPEPVQQGDPMGSGAAEMLAQPAASKKRSVLEGVEFEPTVGDAWMAENARLSNREYAERTPQPDARPRTQAKQGRRQKPNAAEDKGRLAGDAGFFGRAAAKAVSSAAEGLFGAGRAMAETLEQDGAENLLPPGSGLALMGARVGAALAGAPDAGPGLPGARTFGDLAGFASDAAGDFQRGMGKPTAPEGFNPRGPMPYLQEQAEGAVGSLMQSAGTAGLVGARAVIPMLSLQSAGQQYEQARKAGLAPGEALANAIPFGTFEAIGEKFQGLDKAAQAMGVLLTQGAPREAIKTAGEVLLRNGIREIPGEVITYLGQTGVDLLPGIGLRQDMTMAQFLEGLRDTVVQAGMMGGVVGTAGAATVGASRNVPPPTPSAEQIAREKGFLVASATAPVAPRPTDTQALMDVMSAPTVDAAIDAAEAAIAEQPAAPTPGQQDVQQTVGLITELERLQAEEAAAAPPGVAQTQPAPVASAPQDAAPAQGLLGATEAPPAQMPTKLWTGRRGDGYASDLDAASALTSRRQREPNLDWRIEPRGSRFVLAGYERQPAAETANASVPAEVPAVAAGADRGGLFDATPGVAAGVGNRDAAGPALDAGGVRDQAAGGAVPHGTGAPSSAVTGELQIEIEGQGPMRLSLFDTRQLPDDSAARTAPGPVITRTQGAHLEALGVALGKKVVFYRADRDRAPDGFVADNDTGTLYVNERSGITPVAVLGHEFFHTVKQTDPEIHATLETVVAKRMQVGKVQREYVQRLGYAQGSVIEELTSDIGGDLLNDPTFLPEVFQEIERRHADKAPGMIRKIASIFNTIVTKAISAFRGRNDFGAQQMVDQLQEVRTAFRSGLADYLEKRGISPTTFEADMLDAGRAPGEMQAEDRSRFDKVAVQIEVTAGDGTKATLKIKDAGAAIREYDAREKALVALRMCAGR